MSNQKFKTLEDKLNEEVLERNEEIHTAILALISKRHHFQVGPPGTAKSLLVSRLAAKIDGLPKHGYFHYLLTQFTVPGELYGPPNLQDMRDKGIYRLNTDGKLPKAYIAFLDEIFKGNSSILNANLTIMNERKFFNAEDNPNIPLISMFAASNEMPQGDSLNALWDRLHFRHEIQPLQEASSFIRMLKRPTFEEGTYISLEDIQRANQEADKITLTKNCYEAIRNLRADMDKEGLSATERRWMDCIPIIKAEAWLLGREVAEVDCMRPLMHVLWSELKDRKLVERLILDVANPLDKEASAILDRVLGLERAIKEALNSNPDSKALAKLGVEMHTKLETATKMVEELEVRINASDVPSMILPKLLLHLEEATKLVVENIFGFDSKSGAKAL